MIFRILLFAVCVYIICKCTAAVKNYRLAIGRMIRFRLEQYPERDIHPDIIPQAEGSAEQFQRASAVGDSNDVGELILPDAEEERLCPYYNRTGQIICNLNYRSKEDIYSGRWYGNSELVQDIAAGCVDPDKLL